MVLGEPADIDAAARQRMYGIPSEAETGKRLRVEGAHVPSDAAQQAIGGEATRPDSAMPRGSGAPVDQSLALQVPDYLRASGWSGYRAVLLGLAAALLIAATLLFVPGVRGLFGGGEESTELVAGSGAANETPTAGSAPEVGGLDQPDAEQADVLLNGGRPDVAATASGQSGIRAGETGIETQETQVVESDTGTGMIGRSTEAGQGPPVTGAAPPPDGISGANTVNGITGTGPARMPAEGTPALPVDSRSDIVPMPGEVPLQGWPVQANVEGELPGTMPGTPAAAAERRVASVPADVAGGMDRPGAAGGVAPGDVPQVPALATYLSGKSVLLRYGDEQRAWFRIEPRTAIRAGDRLLALPEFRPKIAFAVGVSLDVSGGTLIGVNTADAVAGVGLPAGDAGAPAINIAYGRIVLINTANDEKQVRLTFGPTAADVRLAPSATLAVEMERKYVPGRDPRRTPAPMTVQLLAPAGNVSWRDAAGERQIDQPAQWSIADGVTSDAVALATLPEWIDHEPNAGSSESLFGKRDIELSLTTTRPVDQQLLEVYLESRKREVKSLAAQCSVHVGQFVPFVEALRDPGQRPNWRSHIDALRSAMALSSESAELVWQTLVQQRGDRAAADLYEMLCGYNQDQIGRTREQVKNGALAQLIQWLESDSLDYRVLAVENLWETTGKRLMSVPDGSPSERAPGIRAWNQRLESGEPLVPVADQ